MPAPAANPVHHRRVWLVRHGESTWNALGLVQGQSDDAVLTLRGAVQARRCARRLAAARATALFSSDLRRAVETSAAVAELLGAEVTYDRRLRERSYGEVEGMPVASLGPDHSGLANGRVVDADAAPPGGESVRDLYQRASEFLSEALAEPGADLVVVCHGGVVRVLLAWLDGVGPDAMAWRPLTNGAVRRRAVPMTADRRQAPGPHLVLLTQPSDMAQKEYR